jgi:hypothetical protein
MNLRSLSLAACVAMVAASASPERAPAQETGSISGMVHVEASPPRRQAPRYGTRIRDVQTIPVVVYLRGQIPGPTPRDFVARPAIVQQDTAFAPSAVVVMTGGTVSFPNRDPFFHNVFSMSGTRRFDLGRYPEGESKDVEFDRPGTVEVFCEVHDFMRGAVVVTENPYHALVDDDGGFTITGIPAGTHTLVAWHPDHGTGEVQVTVTGGGTTRIEIALQR